MPVNHTADFWKRAIKNQMSGGVGTRLEFAFHAFSVRERDHRHVFRFHAAVRHAAGFDDDQAARASDATDVAPGFDDEPARNQIEIGLADVAF